MNGFVQQPTDVDESVDPQPGDQVATAPAPGAGRHRGWLIAAAASLVILLVAGGVALGVASNDTSAPATGAIPPAAGAATEVDPQLAARLTYLVEEEKLAHDIYVLGDSLYGSRVFSNISRSETQHQESIRGLLATYGLSDPSATTAPGVFTDPALQSLYDTLAARVNVSSAEAMQVGILIEQTDIADLATALDENPPADVATVLTRLEAASQNHLRAFTRNA